MATSVSETNLPAGALPSDIDPETGELRAIPFHTADLKTIQIAELAMANVHNGDSHEVICRKLAALRGVPVRQFVREYAQQYISE